MKTANYVIDERQMTELKQPVLLVISGRGDVDHFYCILVPSKVRPGCPRCGNPLIRNQGRTVDQEGIKYIAILSEGSMRDALSLLDQVLNFVQEDHVSYDAVLECLGIQNNYKLDQLLHFMVKGLSGKALLLCKEMLMSGVSEEQVVFDFMLFLRSLIIVGNKECEDMIFVTKDQLEMMRRTSDEIPEKDVEKILELFSNLQNKIRYRKDRRILLELTIVEACRHFDESIHTDIIRRLDDLEEKMNHVMGSE